MAPAEDSLAALISTTTLGSYSNHGEQPAAFPLDLVKHSNKQIVIN